MTKKRNTFEGGTTGAAVTHSPNNTGGGSGDALTTVVVGAGSSVVFDTAHPAHGTKSAKVTPAASVATRLDYDGISSPRLGCAAEFYLTAANTDDLYLAQINSSAGRVVSVHRHSGGTLRLRHLSTASNDQIWTSPVAFPNNQIVRLEMWAEIGTTSTNGKITVAFYAGDSTTPLASASFTDADCGTVNLTRWSTGKINGSVYATPLWIDDMRYDDAATGLIGPVSANVAPVSSAGPNVTGTLNQSVSVTGTDSDTDGSVVTRSWSFAGLPPGAASPTLSGASTATASFTPTVAGRYVLRYQVTDDAGLTSTATTTKVFIPQIAAQVIEITANAGGWSNIGGATDIPAALRDASDATSAQSPDSPASPALVRLRLAPITTPASYGFSVRSNVTTAGSGTATVRLYEGATLRKTWTLTPGTTLATTTLALSTAEIATVGSWNELDLELSWA